MPDAWIYYRSPKPHSPALFAQKYKVQSHLEPAITFLGVWDTVGSLGIPGSLFTAANKEKFAFHDTHPSPLVSRACHALSIDEHRHDFTPTFWTGAAPEGAVIQQVWFAGAHSDVGGGYKTRSLANIPLVWMARQAEAAGLALDWKCLPDPSTLDTAAPSHDSSSGLFALDRYHPTVREVGMKKCDVKFNESLYSALDENGKPVSTINEGIHRSVLSRHAAPAQLCSDDDKGTCSLEPYKPENLAPFFNASVFAGMPVVD